MPDREHATSLTTVLLERPVHGGVCLGRLPGGRVVLVAGGLPGEVVEVDLVERKGVLFGEVRAVMEPSAGRVEAPDHPGLDLAHASYELQLEIKREVVTDALGRALRRGGEVPAPVPSVAPSVTPSVTPSAVPLVVPPVVPSERVWGYRSVVQPAVSRGALGYRRPQTREVVALSEDPVATPAVKAAWATVARRLGSAEARLQGVVEVVIRANDAGEALVTLVATVPARRLLGAAHALTDGGVAGVAHAAYDERGRFRSGFERLAGARSIVQRYGRVELTVGHGSFAQPNVSAASRLFLDLAELAGEGSHAVDLYAGGGPIAMHLAPRFGRVTAFELDRSAMTHGSGDAKRQGFGNVAFVRGDAKRQPLPADAELLVVDPPRAGLAKEVREAIAASGAPKLIYVSCEVSTWARDVADLEARGFSLASVAPYDFYPHTHHVELLSLLVR